MAREADRIEDALRDASELVVGRLQLRTWQALTSATPVDKGTARSGWTPSVGTPVEEAIRAPADEGAARSAASARYSKNQARALDLAARYSLAQGSAFLTNAVPWIVPLNMGSSAQAPSMFVERAIDTAIRSLDGLTLSR